MGFVSIDIQCGQSSLRRPNQTQIFLKHSVAPAMTHVAGFFSAEQSLTLKEYVNVASNSNVCKEMKLLKSLD